MIAALLAAEMTAKSKDPGELYFDLTQEFGTPLYERTDASATGEQKELLARISKADITVSTLAGEEIVAIQTNAPGDANPIGGVKVISENGWFAARPSGTEEIYKIYAESFKDEQHLRQVQAEAESIVGEVFRKPA
jgi:phosphoglucomutase